MSPDASDRPAIYTIGHSRHSPERFVELLHAHGVTAVADVRSSPYSRFSPTFNRETLAKLLESAGIAYVFLGDELGARSKDPECYVDGKVQYRRLARTELFQQGLKRVETGARRYRLALMCAEAEPLDCHRTILVARELVALGWPVRHILSDGQLESHETTIERLFDMLGLGSPAQLSLLPGAADETDRAYAERERRIAYQLEQPKDTSVAEGE